SVRVFCLICLSVLCFSLVLHVGRDQTGWTAWPGFSHPLLRKGDRQTGQYYLLASRKSRGSEGGWMDGWWVCFCG
ncbi:hypothetical protein GE09DRAFT_1103579, partial [Coniochaeta sp. 2T2.1]